jgi:ATP synthase protein I
LEQEQLKQVQERIEKFKNRHLTPELKKKVKIDALGIALDLVVSVMIGFFAGFTLDKFFNTKPFCIIIFLLIGILAGFKIIWQKLNSKK